MHCITKDIKIVEFTCGTPIFQGEKLQITQLLGTSMQLK
jgi:hypothetical protein